MAKQIFLVFINVYSVFLKVNSFPYVCLLHRLNKYLLDVYILLIMI